MMQKANALGSSTRTTAKHSGNHGDKGDAQGELKIKFTDCAKQPDITLPFAKDPQPGKQEQF